MCDPVSALLGVGTAVSTMAQVGAGRSANQLGQFEQRAEEQNARFEREAAHAEEMRFRRQSERFMARQAAALAKSGVDLSFGTPLLVAADSARELELDALNIRTSGEVRARDAERRGAVAAFRGREQRKQEFLGAGASLLTGAADIINL